MFSFRSVQRAVSVLCECRSIRAPQEYADTRCTQHPPIPLRGDNWRTTQQRAELVPSQYRIALNEPWWDPFPGLGAAEGWPFTSGALVVVKAAEEPVQERKN
jgi:hypothetical protein